MAERVKELRGLLAGGAWYGDASSLDFARKWGISLMTVRGHVTEAHRQLTADPVSLEQDRYMLAQFCGRMRLEASQSVNRQTGMRDVSAALKAAELEGKYRGLLRPPADDPPPPPVPHEPARIEVTVLATPAKAAG